MAIIEKPIRGCGSEAGVRLGSHGGASTGPRTPQGLETSKKARLRQGMYSKEAKQRRRAEPQLRRWYKKRNGVEATISHMKNDGWPGQNFLKGMMGNRMSALPAASGHNIRKLLRWLEAHPGAPLLAFLRLLAAALSAPARRRTAQCAALAGFSGATHSAARREDPDVAGQSLLHTRTVRDLSGSQAPSVTSSYFRLPIPRVAMYSSWCSPLRDSMRSTMSRFCAAGSA